MYPIELIDSKCYSCLDFSISDSRFSFMCMNNRNTIFKKGIVSEVQLSAKEFKPDELCDANTEILLDDWTCKKCEEFTHPDAQGTSCISDTCDEHSQILLTSGFCETCADFSHADAS